MRAFLLAFSVSTLAFYAGDWYGRQEYMKTFQADVNALSEMYENVVTQLHDCRRGR